MTSREDIVAALSTVPGLSVSDTQPAVVVAGSAWPVWRQTVWRNQVRDGARELSWYVVVALPATGRDATVAEADPIVEDVGMALADAGLGVQTVQPSQVAVANGGDPVPALRYTLTD